jgi:predicted peptidase
MTTHLQSAAIFLAGVFTLSAILSGCTTTTPVNTRMQPVGEQTAVPDTASTAPFGYHQYIPPLASDGGNARYPLLLFLHGSGERGNGGSELQAVTRHGPPKLIREGEWDASRPFIVLSPQLPASQGRWEVDSLHAFIDYAVETYRVDPDRIYLTGLSLGGHGTWMYAAAHPDRIAAAVPVAGDGRVIRKNGSSYCDLLEVPIWAFHGAEDPVVDPRGSMEPIRELRQCQPSSPQKLTLFPGVGHDSWSLVYDGSGRTAIQESGYDLYDENLYSWMLRFPR